MRRHALLAGLWTLVGTAASALTPITPNGEPVSGTLEATDAEAIPAVGLAQSAPGYHRDIYTFEGQAGETVDITLNAQFDGFLILLGPTGTLIESNDDYGDASTSRIATRLPSAGTHAVVVSSFSQGDTGAYTLTVQSLGVGAPVPALSGPGTPGMPTGAPGMVAGAQAPPIQGTVVQGTLDPTDTPPLPPGVSHADPGHYRDIYPLEGRANGMVSIDLTATFDAYLILLGPDGREVASNDDFGSTTNSRIEEATLPQAGTYQVVVTSFSPGTTGNYTLTIGNVTDAPPLSPDTPLQLGQTVQGTLEEGDNALMPPGLQHARRGYHRDGYVYSGTAGESVQFDLSCTFDGYLYLLDPNGQVLGENDDFGSVTVSRVGAILAQTGPHRLIVTSLTEGDNGSYTLTASQGAPPSADSPIAVGQTVQGALMAGDNAALPATARHSGSAYLRDGHVFEATPGQVVTINLASDFDGYLYLVGPDGQVLGENDDSGSTRASQIQATLTQAGPHRIVVTSYGSGAVGNYTLTVSPGAATVAPAVMPTPTPAPPSTVPTPPAPPMPMTPPTQMLPPPPAPPTALPQMEMPAAPALPPPPPSSWTATPASP